MPTVVIFQHLLDRALHRRDAVAQTQGDALRLGADPNVSRQLAVIVILLFDRNINQGVFSKYTDF